MQGDEGLLDSAAQSGRLIDVEPVIGVAEDDDVTPVDVVGVEHRDRDLVSVTQRVLHGARGDLVGLNDEGAKKGRDQDEDRHDEQQTCQPLPRGADLGRWDGGGDVPTRLDGGRKLLGLVVGLRLGIWVDERVVVPLSAVVINRGRVRGRLRRLRRAGGLLRRVGGRGAAGGGDGRPGSPADLGRSGLLEVQLDVVGLVLRRSHRAPSP